MCGIIGTIGNCHSDTFSTAMESIRHRGPDCQQTYLYDYDAHTETTTIESKHYKNCLIMGHTRLSIIDLSTDANQPMIDENFVIVFNGEIYNYRELRKELEICGYTFKTKSDTEVLLKSFIHWGNECVHRFNGMWAFVIYDKKNHQCFISRDRLGVKPLYYCFHNDSFYFASEIKALLCFGIPAIADKDELIRFLIYGAQEHLETTSFKNIFRFPAGCHADFKINTKELKIQKFFDLENATNENDHTEDEIIHQIKGGIDSSLDLRLRSDVPIGMALSGGVDSNIIVHLVHQRQHKIASFSSVYTDNEHINETDNINITVNKLNLQSHFVAVDKNDIVNHIEQIVWHQDEPFDTLGILAQNKVYGVMNQAGIKVSLDGQGADEIFAGYPTYKSIFMREKISHILMYKNFFDCGFITLSNIKLLILSFFPKLFEKLYFQKRANHLFTHKIPFIPSKKKGFALFSNVNQKLIQDTKEYLPVLLRYVDRNSMQFSIESRGIFLDYRVIQDALQIPSGLKIKNCFSKYILRKAYDDLVPHRILWDHKKLGFPVPQKQWMEDKEIVSLFQTYLENSKLIKLLNINKIPQNNSDIYWRLVNVAIWEKVFHIEDVA
ncbi:MAG: asparagine synthase (glutamine-hydrolyzing) [Sulfuricurvum sp.]|uniref:asparagine synthase (glutamine-hydrolyzing) n=1 Tax=Sulfuricurvum sp. TaxID=2025608 RepID=UPI00271E7EDD|nr:asparagine synthase (glutamine-hydrolyzing) [Sulfuricurvum sp.]MDO9056599.1 asparagine synthase (glutamine-hydrolyzing) [Sulfuricurvum sp.]